jgi:hypothetical protein
MGEKGGEEAGKKEKLGLQRKKIEKKKKNANDVKTAKKGACL